ncbi:succinyldiaminopimelate transaminase [Corynebacterium caspium]|uniref:succinyldiaminopimelate transaminase n=1 Tax=Corynebacterium caspium TaxID=234828 RepID=UPI0003629B7D|nr:succinyldiaminopimelate transaminase [Corynebacterium caspium]WKD59515.1 LL-diaminopimelate aminotransferase [Corynebacterium caspium DSM 44850]
MGKNNLATRRQWAKLLPDFPWDSLAAAQELAAAHPEGMIDLSVGSPVDPVAPGIALALAEHAQAPGYPPPGGSQELQQAILLAAKRRFGITAKVSALPVIGLKEAIASLPHFLGLGATHSVAIPELAYPTYEVGARLAGCQVLRGGKQAELIFLNSPANPTGEVLSAAQMREYVALAHANKAIVVSDECYLGLGWNDARPPLSILHPDICGNDPTGLIALHSLSKSANMASYRAGWALGDPTLIAELGMIRKSCGLVVPGAIQAAILEAVADDYPEAAQKSVYAQRRAQLLSTLFKAGFQIDSSDGGLYIWTTRGEPAMDTVADLAAQGILVAPGTFYGPAGEQHIRVSLTATNDDVRALADRLN